MYPHTHRLRIRDRLVKFESLRKGRGVDVFDIRNAAGHKIKSIIVSGGEFGSRAIKKDDAKCLIFKKMEIAADGNNKLGQPAEHSERAECYVVLRFVDESALSLSFKASKTLLFLFATWLRGLLVHAQRQSNVPFLYFTAEFYYLLP